MVHMASNHHNHACNTGLSLGLTSFNNTSNKKEKPSSVVSLKFDHVLPSLSLGPSDRSFLSSGYNLISVSPGSSSYSNNNNNSGSMKRWSHQGEEVEMDKVSPRLSDEEDEASPRKKLRLTKDQCAVLEDRFKEHSTLNPNQKQALARQLNLRPRQVEVWFQNRRARTKLKQTETDCELLKKRCEMLTEENQRLQKELRELKAVKLAAGPVYMRLPPATLSMCPSCDHRHYSASAGRPVFSGMNGTKPAQLFTHSSAAC